MSGSKDNPENHLVMMGRFGEFMHHHSKVTDDLRHDVGALFDQQRKTHGVVMKQGEQIDGIRSDLKEFKGSVDRLCEVHHRRQGKKKGIILGGSCAAVGLLLIATAMTGGPEDMVALVRSLLDLVI